jgi:hypothetical protein
LYIWLLSIPFCDGPGGGGIFPPCHPRPSRSGKRNLRAKSKNSVKSNIYGSGSESTPARNLPDPAGIAGLSCRVADARKRKWPHVAAISIRTGGAPAPA